MWIGYYAQLVLLRILLDFLHVQVYLYGSHVQLSGIYYVFLRLGKLRNPIK
jgi:hypothetical protein